MNNSADEVLKAIPDFGEFMAVTSKIAGLMHQKLSLETKIKEGEAKVFKEASTNEAYFQNGKPPAVSFIDNTFKYTGFDNELVPLRQNLADVTAELEGTKLQLEVYKQMVEIWRTLCSNQRSSGF